METGIPKSTLRWSLQCLECGRHGSKHLKFKDDVHNHGKIERSVLCCVCNETTFNWALCRWEIDLRLNHDLLEELLRLKPLVESDSCSLKTLEAAHLFFTQN